MAMEVDYVRIYQNTSAGGTGDTSGGNLVINPGFETGSLTPWTTYGNAQIFASNASNGIYSVGVGAGSGVFQTLYHLKPSTTYLLKASAKVTQTASNGGAYIGVKYFGGDETYFYTTSTDYSSGSLTFTTGASNTSWSGPEKMDTCLRG
jgi:hypothetical protein